MPNDKEALDAYSEVVTNVAKRIGPTVVQIETNRAPRNANPYFGYRDDRVVMGLGSGFIYDSSGLILTNAHVVADASTITVKFSDGRAAMPGTLVRAERREDLAIVRIQSADRLPVAELSSEPLQPGQLVVAIGNPFGLGWSVTAGVVSAIGRPLESPEEGIALRNLIQTQTPINPGNSGGPLLNGHAKVVGITTAVLPNGQGIGFAIPVDSILDFLARASQNPTPDRVPLSAPQRRVSMGISIIPVNFPPEIVRALPNHQAAGVMIVDVAANSPAAMAGLRARDIILTADSHAVQDPRDLAGAVQRHKAGDKVIITFLREYKIRQVTLVLA
jgi:S1-C subfamily serine protease